MRIPLYQVDAFASRPFEGNPAAVCPLESWLPDELMQAIAAENNLSETAFIVPAGDAYAIRWFTPAAEVELCGHATLASAFVVFNELGHRGDTVVFDSRSGPLPVSKDGDHLTLDFPAQPPESCPMPDDIEAAFGVRPVECLRAADLIVVFDSAETVRGVDPDIRGDIDGRNEVTGITECEDLHALSIEDAHFVDTEGQGVELLTLRVEMQPCPL